MLRTADGWYTGLFDLHLQVSVEESISPKQYRYQAQKLARRGRGVVRDELLVLLQLLIVSAARYSSLHCAVSLGYQDMKLKNLYLLRGLPLLHRQMLPYRAFE